MRVRAAGTIARTAQPDGVTLRPASRADLDALAGLDRLLPLHQSLAPCFSPRPAPPHAVAREEWVEVLAPGAPVLHLHIPVGRPLELEGCRRSLEEALRFFPACFPEVPFVAFSCTSWLLDAQLEVLLPPSSNLVRFLRQMYLLPMVGDGREAFEWVFDGVPTDLAQAPRDTTLRRALLDHLLAGGHLRGGSCFLLPEDLPRWGTDIYRHDA